MKKHLKNLYIIPLILVLEWSCQLQKTPTDSYKASSSSISPSSDYYVSTSGNDTNAGNFSAPFKTITHAVQMADTNQSIQVLPGTYDVNNGEVFPITLKKGQLLIGTPWNKGAGTDSIVIEGTNGFSGFYAALYLTNSCTVIGFSIGTKYYITLGFAVYISNADVEISYNTFISPSYGGVYAIGKGSPNICNNDFIGTSSYAVYFTDIPTGNPLVEYNHISSGSIPINFASVVSNTTVRHNVFDASSSCGIQVQNGTCIISNNIFTNNNGYIYGALDLENSSPIVRNNTFVCRYNAIVIRENSMGRPDLGNASNSGNNNFTGVISNAVSMWSNTHTTNYAIGNIWPQTLPTSNDINFDQFSTGRVYYGTNASDYLGQ
jgi:hypothetical protein